MGMLLCCERRSCYMHARPGQRSQSSCCRKLDHKNDSDDDGRRLRRVCCTHSIQNDHRRGPSACVEQDEALLAMKGGVMKGAPQCPHTTPSGASCCCCCCCCCCCACAGKKVSSLRLVSISVNI